MVKMMNAGILGFFIQQEQIVSQNNMLSLEKAQKLLLKLHQQTTWIFNVLPHMDPGWVLDELPAVG